MGMLHPDELWPLLVEANGLSGGSRLKFLCENGTNFDWSQLSLQCEAQVVLLY